jgi:hypothetical protein
MNNKLFERTEEEKTRCNELNDKFRDDLLKRQLSNNESYDKAILSLSSAGLALSLTAIRFVVPLENAMYLWTIKLSWFLFLVTIIFTLVAYIVGNNAIVKSLEIAEKYYILGLVSAQSEKNSSLRLNELLNKFTGIFFVVAITLVVAFVIFNVGNNSMSDKKTTPTRAFAIDSADVPKMQMAPGKGPVTPSADIPKMQMAPGKGPVTPSADIPKMQVAPGSMQSTKGSGNK